MAEGAPLLREYRVKSLIEGSNPSLSASLQKALFLQGFFVGGNILSSPVFSPDHGRPGRLLDLWRHLLLDRLLDLCLLLGVVLHIDRRLLATLR